MSKPDFCIIGAMKCGTSTLAHQLSLQPGIFMTTPKEPNFFSDDDQYAKGLTWYADLYTPSQPGDLLGEASTHYTKWPVHPQAPERFADYAPGAKLIYMVRQPVGRAISHLRHAWTQREMSGSLENAAKTMDILWQYGCYNNQLSRWLELYPTSRVLVVALERMNQDPDGELDRVLKFLGAEGSWVHDESDQNTGADRSRKLPFQDLLVDNKVASALRHALVPKSIRTKIREARQLKKVEVSVEAKERIADLTREDILAFGHRFGIDDLSPENFVERVKSHQLDFAGTSDT